MGSLLTSFLKYINIGKSELPNFPCSATTNTTIRVTDLPCEVIIAVFKQLGHIQFLLPCLLTCRHFYHSYKANPRLAIGIIKRQVGPALLAYSIAVQEAGPHAQLSATELLEILRNKPDILIDRLRDYPLTSLVQLGHTHDLVEKYANEFAEEAWGSTDKPVLQPIDRFPFGDLLYLSPAEEFRFYRAFYRHELYVRFFLEDNPQVMQLIKRFFRGHSPWENEQLICVYDYLHSRQGISSIINNAGLTRHWRYGEKQFWISRGLSLFNQLENVTSYKELQLILESNAPDLGQIRYPSIHGHSSDEAAESRHYYKSRGSLTALDKDKEDRDEGPVTIWKELPSYGNKANRLCAYVLWDLTRIQKYDMLNFFLDNHGDEY
ncbi:hypothetical protein F4680DRAFT_464300 [Xylaria scruposa]|nr:hypothetical protein F4680DRAFT_464300 [Xylaria scruposa]